MRSYFATLLRRQAAAFCKCCSLLNCVAEAITIIYTWHYNCLNYRCPVIITQILAIAFNIIQMINNSLAHIFMCIHGEVYIKLCPCSKILVTRGYIIGARAPVRQQPWAVVASCSPAVESGLKYKYIWVSLA